MPSSRFWEMEDAKIDLGAVDAAPQDLGRLLMVGYATVYGNDWYVVPVRLPIGTLCRITTFMVTNVFGLTETVGPAAVDSPDFNLFGLSDPREHSGANPWFLLAPALPGSLESAPIEHVLIARDEMANLAWAIEQRVEDDAGVPYDRYDAMTRPPRRCRRDAYLSGGLVRPRLLVSPCPRTHRCGPRSGAAAHFPLSRRESAGGAAGVVTTVLPLGGILEAARGPNHFWLHEEEVPRSGVDVMRSHQRARWHDGSVHSLDDSAQGHRCGRVGQRLRFDTVKGS